MCKGKDLDQLVHQHCLIKLFAFYTSVRICRLLMRIEQAVISACECTGLIRDSTVRIGCKAPEFYHCGANTLSVNYILVT